MGAIKCSFVSVPYYSLRTVCYQSCSEHNKIAICTVQALSTHTYTHTVLNSFIKHYEPLHYDSESLMWNHHRVRRSMIGERELELKFSAFDK